MLSQASVILCTGGVSARHPLGRHISWVDTPLADTPQADTPQADTDTDRHLWGRHPPLADTPLGRHPPPHQQTASAANATHPTGMHSCWNWTDIIFVQRSVGFETFVHLTKMCNRLPWQILFDMTTCIEVQQSHTIGVNRNMCILISFQCRSVGELQTDWGVLWNWGALDLNYEKWKRTYHIHLATMNTIIDTNVAVTNIANDVTLQLFKSNIPKNLKVNYWFHCLKKAFLLCSMQIPVAFKR